MSGCYIAGAGEYCCDVLPEEGDFIIAADAGYIQLQRFGIMPDLIVGDFDSIGVIPMHHDIVRHPAEKNDTDVLLAVKEALSRGYKTIVINGGLGGRLDHTLANVQILAFIARQGARGYLTGKDIYLTAVTDGAIKFTSDAAGYISVFCAGEKAVGVTLEGLKYPLSDATLTLDFPLGVSNEFTGIPARVSVREGTLIVTWADGLDCIAHDG